MIVSPTPVSLSLWWRLAWQDSTLLRSLEDECVSNLKLKGRTLDIGGGKGFGYVDRLCLDGQLDSVNIAPSVNPTIVADLNCVLPIADNAYDNVISFNTFEHVFEEKILLEELLRVLRPGGRFVITVPFLFNRHGNYGDFHRHTAEYWESVLGCKGLHTDKFLIRPLVWCPLSSSLATHPWFRGGVKGRLLKLLILSFRLFRRKGLNKSSVDRNITGWALGFYIDGIKAFNSEKSDYVKFR